MDHDDIVFRDATAVDVDGVVTLVESAYRGEFSRVGWTTEADLMTGPRTNAKAVLEIIEAADSHLLIALRRGEMVACCHVEHRGGHANFGMFAVRPDLQGSGLGRLVLAEAERVATRLWNDAGEMRMTVISLRDDLIAWYERRGYQRTGRTIPFPVSPDGGSRPLRPDVEFELLVKTLRATTAGR